MVRIYKNRTADANTKKKGVFRRERERGAGTQVRKSVCGCATGYLSAAPRCGARSSGTSPSGHRQQRKTTWSQREKPAARFGSDKQLGDCRDKTQNLTVQCIGKDAAPFPISTTCHLSGHNLHTNNMVKKRANNCVRKQPMWVTHKQHKKNQADETAVYLYVSTVFLKLAVASVTATVWAVSQCVILLCLTSAKTPIISNRFYLITTRRNYSLGVCSLR